MLVKNWPGGNPQVSMAQIAQGIVYAHYMRAKGTAAAAAAAAPFFFSFLISLFLFLFCHPKALVVQESGVRIVYEVEFQHSRSASVSLGHH